MATLKTTYAKLLYALLFLVIVPAVLFFWTDRLDALLALPSLGSTLLGSVLVVLGILMMGWAMTVLTVFGKGLPMNPFPPTEYVKRSIYRIIPHPIYLGFGLVAGGCSIYFGSGAGLFITTPLVLLGCTALVWGYESHDLQKRFPDVDKKTLISVPADTPDRTTVSNKVSLYVLAYLPWIILSNLLLFLFPSGRVNPNGPLIDHWLIEVAYWIGVLLVVGAPMVVRNKSALRRSCISGCISIVLLIGAVILWPQTAGSHVPRGEFLDDVSVGGWPVYRLVSFHAVFLLIALRMYAGVLKPLLVFGLGITGAAGFLPVSPSPGSYLILSLVIFGISYEFRTVWSWIRRGTEVVANSWREWQWGGVRVINHGFYIGIGVFAGTLAATMLLGESYVVPIVVFGFVVVITSALWAQLIEGSEKLKRPFGFYGGMVGILFGSGVMYLMEVEIWPILAAISVVMPLVQSFGRLRCLVNGCCHGKEAVPEIGIRYFHPRSRVTNLAGMKGVSLHPTPLYSVLWLLPVGILLWRVWSWGAPCSLIFGLYLVLTGIGRFVEESYRGEPQTPVPGGLRLYQWAALASVVIGMAVIVIPSPAPTIVQVAVTPEIVAGATILAVFGFLAMGVDFPRSNARFSRLV